MIPAFMTILPADNSTADKSAEVCMQGATEPRIPLIEKRGGGAYLVGCLVEYDEEEKCFRDPGFYYVSLN